MVRPLTPTLFVLGICLFSLPAAADTSVQDVWSDIERAFETSIGDIDIGARRIEGRTLALSDLTLHVAIEGLERRLRVMLPEMRLTGQSDGTVEISAPSLFPLRVTATDPSTGEETQAEMQVELDGASVSAARHASGVRYALPGGEMRAELAEIVIGGLPLDVGVMARATGFADSWVSSDAAAGDVTPGDVEVTLTGAVDLLNRLADAGVIGQSDAVAGVFMLGMFSRPGEGPDTLVTNLSVNGNGEIAVNGQPLR